MSAVEQTVVNPMLSPRIGKVTINICTGKSGEMLEKASKVLEQLTGQTPCQRSAKQTVRDWGVRKGEPIACIVTLRGEKAIDFLKRAFEAVENKISASSFDNLGNVAFGIKEHIEIPGVRYDHNLGIFGMDVCISFERIGYRLKRKRIKSKIGAKHVLTAKDTIPFLANQFKLEIVGSE
jgi:large subunit ribosomal protein L5